MIRILLFNVIFILLIGTSDSADITTEEAGLQWRWAQGLYAHNVDKDYAFALKMLRPLAEEGYAKAQHKLSFMYLYGRGVPQDFVLAHMWFNTAAASQDLLDSHGEISLHFDRQKIEEKMSPSQIAEAQKLARKCVAKNYKGC